MKSKFGIKTVKLSILIAVIISLFLLIIGIMISNNLVLTQSMKQQSTEELTAASELASSVIDGWVEKQFQIAHTITGSLEFIQTADDNAIANYLDAQLAKNEDALMYYVAYEASKKIIAADHSNLTDVDPTSGDYWIKAMAKQDVVFSTPYDDAVSGKWLSVWQSL